MIAYTLSATLFFFTACNPMKKMNKENGSLQLPSGVLGAAFDIQGHRGCRGLMPENTIPAMRHALGLGVTTLEMDVVITKDKKVILSHEPFFNHEITTKPGGGLVSEEEERSLNIYQMNYEEVSKYDVGMKPHPRYPQQQKMNAVKPLLSEVFDSVNDYMKDSKSNLPFFNIETKCLPAGDKLYHPGPAEFVDLLMKVISEKQMEQRVTIQSFDFRTLQYLHKTYPRIRTVMLIEDSDKTGFDEQLKKLGYTPEVYSPHFSLVTEDLIKRCHALNVLLIPWTVNEKPLIDRLQKAGVDGIITDYPNLFN